ncbi:hypothetical protein BH23ACT3_BH23ACT3_00510 [soil metagenome]
MSFEFDFLEGGSINVDYPVTVTFSAPADNSFDPGDVVRIGTSVAVNTADAKISVSFPEFKAFRISPTVELDANASYRLCFGDCTSGTALDIEDYQAMMGIRFSDGKVHLEDGVHDFARGCSTGSTSPRSRSRWD